MNTRRLLWGRSRLSNFYEVSIVYAAQGRTYTTTFMAYEEYTEGRTLPILYNPADPQRNSKSDPKGDNTQTLIITLGCLAAALLLLLLRGTSRF